MVGCVSGSRCQPDRRAELQAWRPGQALDDKPRGCSGSLPRHWPAETGGRAALTSESSCGSNQCCAEAKRTGCMISCRGHRWNRIAGKVQSEPPAGLTHPAHVNWTTSILCCCSNPRAARARRVTLTERTLGLLDRAAARRRRRRRRESPLPWLRCAAPWALEPGAAPDCRSRPRSDCGCCRQNPMPGIGPRRTRARRSPLPSRQQRCSDFAPLWRARQFFASRERRSRRSRFASSQIQNRRKRRPAGPAVGDAVSAWGSGRSAARIAGEGRCLVAGGSGSVLSSLAAARGFRGASIFGGAVPAPFSLCGARRQPRDKSLPAGPISTAIQIGSPEAPEGWAVQPAWIHNPAFQ